MSSQASKDKGNATLPVEVGGVKTMAILDTRARNKHSKPKPFGNNGKNKPCVRLAWHCNWQMET